MKPLQVCFRHFTTDSILANLELTELPSRDDTVVIERQKYRVFEVTWFIFRGSMTTDADVVIKLSPKE